MKTVIAKAFASFSKLTGALKAVSLSLTWAGIHPCNTGYFISSMSERTTSRKNLQQRRETDSEPGLGSSVCAVSAYRCEVFDLNSVLDWGAFTL